MNYEEFYRHFKKFPVFSIKEIRKVYPDFDRKRIVEWKKKGYLLNIRRGYYCFKEKHPTESFRFHVANKIYSPSYISLETGMGFYSFIPEGVFVTTSITTRNTSFFSTELGQFDYHNIKESLFFGYNLIEDNQRTIKIADPEKLILDYLYFGKIDSLEELKSQRLNTYLIKDLLDLKKFYTYQSRFNSRVLNKRVKLFLDLLNA